MSARSSTTTTSDQVPTFNRPPGVTGRFETVTHTATMTAIPAITTQANEDIGVERAHESTRPGVAASAARTIAEAEVRVRMIAPYAVQSARHDSTSPAATREVSTIRSARRSAPSNTVAPKPCVSWCAATITTSRPPTTTAASSRR